MAAHVLTREMIDDGRALLDATDKLGMAAEGAAWRQDPWTGRWSLLLATSLVDEIGPREIYEKLGRAVRLIARNLRVSPLLVDLRSPNDQPFRTLRKANANIIESGGLTIDGWSFGYVYRSSPPLEQGHVEETATRFREEVDRVLSAA